MKRITKIRLITVIAIIIYVLLKFMVSPIIAYIFAGFVGLCLLKYILSKSRIWFHSSSLINDVPKRFKMNNNTLVNDHCIVKYFPKEKIVIIDKPKSKYNSNLRSFVIDKTNTKNIVYCWGDICAIFDELTYLDTLYSYFDGFTGKFNVRFINSDDELIKDMAEFFRKPVEDNDIKKESFTPKRKVDKPALVDFDNLKTKEAIPDFSQKSNENTDYLQELNSESKIYVNYADAQKISELPGINIIKAKKIVAYRDINGLFMRKENFIKIADVKEHFIPLIKEIISLEKDPQMKEYDYHTDYGRTVD